MNPLNLALTDNEEAIFFGNLLGDGHIQKRGSSFRTKIEHSIKQKEYVLWKYEKLKRLTESNQPPKKVKSKKNNESYLFYLQSGKYLEKYHTLFYQPYDWKSPIRQENEGEQIENRLITKRDTQRYAKVINQKLIETLPQNPLVLAVWFLDDGSCRDDVFSGKLATQGFSKEENKLLQEYLVDAFNIKTQVVRHHKKKNQYYLSIPAKGNHFSNLVDLIQPIVNEIPCMQYKIKNPRND